MQCMNGDLMFDIDNLYIGQKGQQQFFVGWFPLGFVQPMTHDMKNRWRNKGLHPAAHAHFDKYTGSLVITPFQGKIQ